jgi:hypothetical protein
LCARVAYVITEADSIERRSWRTAAFPAITIIRLIVSAGVANVRGNPQPYQRILARRGRSDANVGHAPLTIALRRRIVRNLGIRGHGPSTRTIREE